MQKKILSIPADINYLSKVRNFIQKIAYKNHFSNKVINAVKLAVEEVCSNIIRHGYQNKDEGSIQIEIIISKTSITVIIIDQGQTYDPKQVKDPDLLKYVEIGKVGGLGIMMVRKLMDEIDYLVTSRGNEFRLTKYKQKVRDSRFFKLWQIYNRARNLCYTFPVIYLLHLDFFQIFYI